MPKRFPDSARFVWVDAFVAFAAYGSATAAGKAIKEDATTVMRRIRKLESWLRRILLTRQHPPQLTAQGVEFLDAAVESYLLSVNGGIREERSITKVTAAGRLAVEGAILETGMADRIGKLLTAWRIEEVTAENIF